MKGHIHSRIAKLLVVLALAVVASVMFVFVGCSSECEHEKTHTETVAATCTTAGSEKTVCDDCGETIKTETIDALGHKWDEGKVVAATCAAGGYTLKTCTVCGTQQQTDLTEALPHAWKNTTTVEATCEKDGYTEQTCEACGATRRVNIVAAEGHKWANKEVAATCGTAGRTYQECSVCGEIRNQVTIPATGAHDWVAGKTTDATCVVNGYTEYTCSGCGATKQEVTEIAEGHKWKKLPVLREEATCTTDGYTYTECENCDERQTIDIIPATGHTYEWKVTKALTCTTDGTITGTCKDCDAKVSYTADQYAALDDQQKTALKISDAIYTANGGKEAFLQATGHYYYSVKLGEVTNDAQHKYDTPTAGDKKDDPLFLNCQDIGKVTIDEKEADYTGYSLVCTCCDTKVKTAAHTPDDENAYVCVDGGKDKTDDYAWECTLCGHKEEMEEHDYQLIDIKTGEVAAEGTVYNCLVKLACAECGALKDENQPRGPHAEPSADDPEDKIYLANCQHGTMCTICEEEVYDAKLPHNLVKVEAGTTVAGETAVASTCTVKGKDVWACSMCQELEKAGTEITWTRATSEAQSNETGNYFSKEADLLPHEWVSKTVSNNESDPNGDLCITTTWKIDTCKNCPATRIETTAEVAGERPVTDAQGRYDVENGEADHKTVLVTDPSVYEGTGYELPTCTTKGVLLQTCANEGCKFLSAKKDITLDQFAEQTLINAGNADPSDEEIAAKKAELLKDQRFHAEKMYDCGHPYCPACVPADEHHDELQWSVSFQFAWDQDYAAELPTLDTFTAYYCWVAETNMQKFEDYRTTFEEKYPDYTFAYYTDAAHTKLADFGVIGADKGEDQYTGRITLYVVVTPKTAVTVAGVTGSWASGAAEHSLYAGIMIDNRFIAYDSITRIDVDVYAPADSEHATSVAGASSYGEYLEKLYTETQKYPTSWIDPDKGDNVYTLEIGYFCVNPEGGVNADSTWVIDATELSDTATTNLSGYEFVWTITCGDVEFVYNFTVTAIA